MSERLRLVGGEKPFRVFAAGANTTNPTFSDVLFDGDSSTLRVWMRGATTVGVVANAGGTQGWQDVNKTAISLGKTFPHPPLATGFLRGQSAIAAPNFIIATNSPGGGQFPNVRAWGVWTTRTTLTVFMRNSVTATETHGYVVFDNAAGA